MLNKLLNEVYYDNGNGLVICEIVIRTAKEYLKARLEYDVSGYKACNGLYVDFSRSELYRQLTTKLECDR